ncbi:Zinc finger MYM-type protein 1-like [Oopsacas minuta]|uniref:Zinc finger MYM-type protein 1-like n=1 Tax=Oopsacas minuta TaxID=111878 RepID=A0AAV7JDN6_9METZ|nr:Zinc finger MYM-type protein 1-like [Oopsacas minuta]
MSKHQEPIHCFFSKRPRVATGSSDAINYVQVAIVDPNSVPNDISKTAREGPTQVELLKYPVDTNERRLRKEWFKDSVWLEYSQIRDSAFCYAGDILARAM